ncbi:MAG TPA: ATP-binding protein [Clostridium sp.]|nr:ATP-binding protein [Clostridium sp.]
MKFETYASKGIVNDVTDSFEKNTENTFESKFADNKYQTKPAIYSKPKKSLQKDLPFKEIYSNDNLARLQRNMGNCLEMIDDEVMKGYITKLSELPVIAPNREVIEKLQEIHFFKITELVYQEEEFSVHKLSTVFHSLSNKPCTLVLMIKSDGQTNDFYLGVRSLDKNYSSGTMMQMLKQSLMGMFPGSRIDGYYNEDMKSDMAHLNPNCVSSVTCVADYKQSKDNMTNEDFIQGLEKFIYSMQDKEYTSIFIADNMSYEELAKVRKEYEGIYTQISPFSKMQFNFSVNTGNSSAQSHSEGSTKTNTYGITEGTNTSVSKSKAMTTGTNESYGSSDSHGINESVADGTTDTVGYSDGTTHSTSDAHSEGKFQSVGVNAGVNVKVFNVGANINKGTTSSDTHTETNGTSHTDSVSNSISKTLTHGITDTHTDSSTFGSNKSESNTSTYGEGTQRGKSYSVGDSFNLVDSKILTDTFGNSQGITLNAENMTLNATLDRLKMHLQRIHECESLGMWNFAAYFLGESAAETETAANTYQSVVSGMQSGIERTAVNTWNEDDKLDGVLTYVKNFTHPQFLYNGFSYDGNRDVVVNPSALVSTNELAIHMGLPRHSVKGLPVIQHASFAQEVLSRNENGDREINIGNIYHLGEKTKTEVKLDVNSLAMHTFITGSTGSGKSNAVYHILDEATNQKIPFLVVEPAKGEYRKVFNNVKCFGTNPNISTLLQLNPFSFPAEIHVLEHVDRLVEIFNVCWPMYAAMPAVLKESIERAYVSAGWDLDLSINKKIDNLFPTFDDVLRELNKTIQSSEYSADTKGDYIGSLSTRIKSLTNGINGRIFVSNEMDLKELFDESAILDISRVGSMETKALIMGLVVLKLQEYRMANAKEMNSALKHITVLEEAHNLLKKTSTEQSQDSSNLVGKSVEMLTNTIAEIRTYGEGFIIVDQAPNLLDTSAIRNTNTKIVLRLPEGNDRQVTGTSMALNDKQIIEISKLPTGVATVYQNDWQEAVLCALPKFENNNGEEVVHVNNIQSRKEENDEILHELLKQNHSSEECKILKKKIFKLNISAKLRMDLIDNLNERNLSFEWAVADFINKNYRFEGIFKGTQNGQFTSLEELSNIMMSNIRSDFEGFDDYERMQILYYICRIQHEIYPQNKVIEELRVNYLKKKVVI